jgi:hypothetical protein
VTTTGGSLYIRFDSDDQNTEDGFLASYVSDIPVFCSGMTNNYEQSGTINDGSGSWNYHDNSACLWRILPEGASSVTLYFNSFETEAGFDILKVYDLQTQQVLAEYSGTYESGVPDPVTSPSGKMFLSFSTNSMNTGAGWEAYFESNLVGIDENPVMNELVIFPNPAGEFLHIQCRANASLNLNIELTDLSGRTVFSSEAHFSAEKTVQIDIKDFSPGIYILRTLNSEGKAEYHKIIKE